MKKKVIMFMPSIEGGGVEKNFFIVANFLSKLKDISVITISRKYQNKFSKKIKFISLNLKLWDKFGRRFKYFLAIFLLIKEIFKDRNFIVFSFQANIYAILICKIFSIKIITRSNSAPYGWSNNLIKKILFKFFLKISDKVMVNSFEFKKDLKKQFNVDAVCIYNPLNTKEIKKNSQLKAKKLFKKNSLKIINVGRFTDQKDQITLLKALNILKQKIKFEAIIMGRGILQTKLQEFISKNHLNDMIKIKDFTKNPFPLIKQADLFILSSSYEGLPNVLLESLVFKKFIISSDCRTGPKEILLNGKGGLLFKVGDYNKLSKLILFYNSNKKRCNSMLNKSVKALHRFDYSSNLKKYLQIIETVQ